MKARRIHRRDAGATSNSARAGRLLVALLGLAIVLVGCGVPGTIAAGGSLPPIPPMPQATPLPPVRFPQDEAPHRDLTEWWYYTGHLEGRDASGQTRTYGFEYVIFQTLRGQLPPFYAAHFAISDITRGEFHYDQRLLEEPNAVIPDGTSSDGFHLAVGDWTMQGLNGHDQLAATMQDYSLSLDLHASKVPVLHGDDGLITLGLVGFSYYYSRTRMPLTGTISDHGVTVQVTGLAWMDHQWGNFLTLNGGWDWYSLQLADQSEIMMYFLRDPAGTITATYATYVAPDGSAASLPPGDFTSKALGTWASPMTQAVYPSGWQVTITSLKLALTLTPELRDQELVTTQSTGVVYWEGAVTIQGQQNGVPISGQGYIELTGYAAAGGA